MGYCRYCGRKLEEGEICTCRQQNRETQEEDYFSNMLNNVNRVYQSARQGDSSGNRSYERGKQIVGGCIAPMEGEIPVRQYNIAILRTIFPHKRAEGRLQVTNKRVIFRASGRCHNGDICSEKEFMLDKISGIEIEKSKRANGWFLLLGILILWGCVLLGSLLGSAMTGSYMDPRKVTAVIGVLIACAGVVAVIFLRKWDWVKEIAFALPGGMLLRYATVLRTAHRYWYGGAASGTVWRILACAMLVAALVFLILFSVKDDLRIHVKADDTLDAITVRRTMHRRRSLRNVYVGFSEVLPWTDTEAAIRELGALINDVKQYGNAGVDKWT